MASTRPWAGSVQNVMPRMASLMHASTVGWLTVLPVTVASATEPSVSTTKLNSTAPSSVGSSS